jgi:hypothetical protein
VGRVAGEAGELVFGMGWSRNAEARRSAEHSESFRSKRNWRPRRSPGGLHVAEGDLDVHTSVVEGRE